MILEKYHFNNRRNNSVVHRVDRYLLDKLTETFHGHSWYRLDEKAELERQRQQNITVNVNKTYPNITPAWIQYQKPRKSKKKQPVAPQVSETKQTYTPPMPVLAYEVVVKKVKPAPVKVVPVEEEEPEVLVVGM